MTEHAFARQIRPARPRLRGPLACRSAGGRSFLCPGGSAGCSSCIFEHVGSGC